MSLADLQKQVNDSGAKALTEQHDKIMREGAEHSAMLEKNAQMKLAKQIKTVEKAIKQSGGSLGH